MKYAKLVVVLVLILAAFVVLSYKRTSQETKIKTSPAKLESIEGTKLSRVTLSEAASVRLNIQTDQVKAKGQGRKTIPYSAVFYGANGDTWTYINLEPFVFVRYPIKIDSIREDLAVLTDGPQVGTEVVTVGAAELYGIELGIGK